MDGDGAGGYQRPGDLSCGGTRGQDIVYQKDVPTCHCPHFFTANREGISDVSHALIGWQGHLGRPFPPPLEQVLEREVEALSKLPSEQFRLIVPTRSPTPTGGRHGYYQIGAQPASNLDHPCRHDGGQRRPALVFQTVDKRVCGRTEDHSGPSRGEFVRPVPTLPTIAWGDRPL